MNNLSPYELSDVTTNFDNVRVPLSAKQRKNIEKVYPYYGAQNIIDYVDNYLFDGEYILVAEDGENLKSQHAKVCNLVKGKFWVNNHAHIIKGKNGNNTRYLYYYLNLIDFRPFITGSAQPKLTKDNLNSIPLSIHDIETQKKISSILSTLDAKIEVNNKINVSLEQMAKTLFDYWFVQFDFPNTEGKPYKTSGGKMIWNDELKRDIPEVWEVKSLADLTNVSSESVNPLNFPNKEFKHYSIPTFDETGMYCIEKGSEIKSNKFIITNTDILVSKLNPWFNRVAYSTDECDLISSTEFVVWRSSNIAMKNYLYMIARDASFISYCTKSASGTSNSHKRVNPTVMMKYKVAYNFKIAELFGSRIGSFIKTYANNQVENKSLSDLRDWLLPMLMNGQVRVN